MIYKLNKVVKKYIKISSTYTSFFLFSYTCCIANEMLAHILIFEAEILRCFFVEKGPLTPQKGPPTPLFRPETGPFHRFIISHTFYKRNKG